LMTAMARTFLPAARASCAYGGRVVHGRDTETTVVPSGREAPCRALRHIIRRRPTARDRSLTLLSPLQPPPQLHCPPGGSP
jgi:hypothetical protein